jgi:hypothetical protein
MAKDVDLGWRSDRKDLIDAVRGMSPVAVKKLLTTHMKNDERAKGLGKMRHEQLANLLMLGLTEGIVPESAVILPCSD